MKLFISVLLLCLISCTRQTESTTVSNEDEIEQPQAESNPAHEQEQGLEWSSSLAKAEADTIPTDTAQIVSFGEPGAFNIYPDTAWLNEAQKDEETYNTILDDYLFYESQAWDTLEWKGIKRLAGGGIVERRYFKFKLSGQPDFYVDLNKIRGTWGFILYNGKDIPSLYSPIDVADVMDSVFRK